MSDYGISWSSGVSRPIFHWFVALAVLFARSATGEVVLSALADAGIRGGTYTNTNYGTASNLDIKDTNPTGDANRKAYLKFNVSGASTNAAVASLRLAMTTPGTAPFTAGSRVFEVFGIPDGGDGWSEGAVTWANAPANDTSGRGFTAGAVSLGTFAITSNTPPNTVVIVATQAMVSYLNNARGPDGLVTLALRCDTLSTELASFASIQNGNSSLRPRLTVDSAASLPAAPIGVSAAAGAVPPGVALSWTDCATNEECYVVSRAVTAGGPYADVTTLPADAVTFVDRTAPVGIQLYYAVRSMNARGASAYSQEAPALITGNDYYVSASDGADLPPPVGGSLSSPFKSIAYAASNALAGSTIYIRGGTYRETIGPPVSGTAAYPITFKAFDNETVVITGLDPVVPVNGAAWQTVSGQVYKIQLSAANGFTAPSAGKNAVFCDGELVCEARWPNVIDPTDFRRLNMAASDSGSVNVAGGADGQGLYAGTYSDDDLSVFTSNAWVGAKMRFTPGWGWSPKTGTITLSTSCTLSFRYNYSNSSSSNWDVPSNGDPYFLFGRLVALDSENEAYFDDGGRDGSQYTLYLWKRGGGSPDGSIVEMRKRSNAVDLSNRAWLRFEKLRLREGAVASNNATTNCTLDDVLLEYGASDWSGGGSAVSFNGAGNRLLNSEVRWSTGHGIVLVGVGHVISNCVIRDCMGQCVNTSFGNSASNVTVIQNTAINSGEHTLSASCKASRFVYNHAYNTGLFTTDLAVLNAINPVDALGTEIGWNWLHDNLAVSDATRTWNGGPGIRLDTGPSNFVIHHNLIWNTTQASSIILWPMEAGNPNLSNSLIRVFNNTADNEIGFVSGHTGGSAAGTVIVNNIAAGKLNMGGLSLAGVTLSNNVSVNAAFAGNLTGPAGFLSPANRNFQLGAESLAVDAGVAIPPYTDGAVGAGSDIGALERGLEPFTAGALLRPEDVAGLHASYQESVAGQAQFVVGGLPAGRSLPHTFRLRVGGGSVGDVFFHNYDFVNHTATATFTPSDHASTTRVLAVQFSLDGANFTDAATPVSVTPFEITGISLVKSLPGGGATVTLIGTGFSASAYRTPIKMSQASAGDLLSVPVLLTVDTATPVAAGRMRSDGGDIRFRDSAGRPLIYWIESGMNTAQTRLWVRYPTNTVCPAFSGENLSVFDLCYGNASLSGESSQGAIFPELARSSLLLRLRAAALSLTSGAAVATWPDCSGNNRDALQATASMRPAFRASPGDLIGGLPVVRFDGNDWFDLSGNLGTSGPYTVFSVYYNPSPGSGTYQRLYSAMPTGTFSSTPDGVTTFNDYTIPGWSYILPYTSGGVVTPGTAAQLKRTSHVASCTGANFRIGKRSQSSGGGFADTFKGDIAELMVFGESLPEGVAVNLETYLRRSYGLGAVPLLTPDFAATANPLSVAVGGVAATNMSVVNSTQITFALPSMGGVVEIKPVSVTVTNASGVSFELTNRFFYYTAPMDGWRIDHFLNNPGGPFGEDAQDLADPDGDGAKNLIEYALGGDPLQSDSAALIRLSMSTDHATLSFQRSASCEDVACRLQAAASLDLVAPWTNLAACIGAGAFAPLLPGVTVNEIDAGALRAVEVHEAVSPSSGAKRFFRLQVERNP